MIFGDIGTLTRPDIFLTGEEKPRKNLTQVTRHDRGSNPGPLSNRRACYCLFPSGGLFSDLLRSVQILKREWVRKATGSYRTYYIPSKTAALVPDFAVDVLPSAEQQPRFLRLQSRTCLWAEHSDDDVDIWISPTCLYRGDAFLRGSFPRLFC